MAFKKGESGNPNGRPKKADEQKTSKAAIHAIKVVFGSENECFEELAKLAKKSYPHLKLLLGYAYGQPTERVNMSQESEVSIKSYKITPVGKGITDK